MFAVILLRGMVGINYRIKDTLSMLRITKANHCTLIPNTPSYDGMLKMCKDFITWGEIDEPTLKALLAKRGRKKGDKRLTKKEADSIAKEIIAGKPIKEIKIKPVFRLSPPSHGFKDLKLPYPNGDLGYRGKEINKLLKNMI